MAKKGCSVLYESVGEREETASTAWHLSPIQRHVHDLVEMEKFSKGSSQMGRASWRQYQYKREEELGKKEKEGGIREMDGLFEGRSKTSDRCCSRRDRQWAGCV